MPIKQYTNNKAELLGLAYARAYKMKLNVPDRELFMAGAKYVLKHMEK